MEKEYLTSRYWGSLFTDDHLPEKNEGKLMNTLWGFIIRKYADVAVPQLEYIAGNSNVFIAIINIMSCETFP